MARIFIALVALLMASCVIGPKLPDQPGRTYMKLSPHGVKGTFRVGNTWLYGELLSVQHNGLVLLKKDQVYFITIQQLSKLTLERGIPANPFDARSADDLNRLRRYSRYPQGLTTDLQRRLLEAYGQTHFITLP